jgi:hypothetical protein
MLEKIVLLQQMHLTEFRYGDSRNKSLLRQCYVAQSKLNYSLYLCWDATSLNISTHVGLRGEISLVESVIIRSRYSCPSWW